MKHEVYDIGGMHCSACSSAVERVTRKLDGVTLSDVNLPMNRLTIEYDETKVTEQMIEAKIEKAGFTAKLHDKQNDTKSHKNDDTIREEKEHRMQKISLIVSVVFSVILLYFSMGHMISKNIPVPDIFSMYTHPMNYAVLQLLLTVPVLFLCRNFFIRGFSSAFHRNPNMDTLVAVSATASFIYSIVMTFMITDNHHAVHHLYYESAAIVVALVSVGKYLEASSKQKTKGAIEKLISLTPDNAILVNENGQWEVPVEKIKAGDKILVKAGAKVPLDGIVTDGQGNIDESMLTGESLPVYKNVGAEVIGGSLSVDGTMYVEVTRTGSDTTLSKIIKFVEDAQGKKAPISKVADKVAGVFVPVVMVIALLSAVIWLIAGKEFSFALRIFTSVLVIACPCAMGLATPTAIIVGTGLGASKGILIRNGETLETTHKTSVVIFDKTGTVTQGNPVVTDIVAEDENKLLNIVYGLELRSQHPLAKAICNEAEKRNIISENDIQNYESITGYGIKSTVNNENYLVGNLKMMTENNVAMQGFKEQRDKFASEGKTVVFVSCDNKVTGIIAIADTLKDTSKEAVAKLNKMGLKTVLLTGDNKITAKYISDCVGTQEVIAEVLPTQKAEIVMKYQQEGNTVMMVGDGINDAPALAQADIGCAIGNGSDIAIESAGVVLMKSDLNDVVRAIKLSRLTITNIRENLFWAFIYNVLGIPVACGVLYPSLGILLSPMIGGLAMSLSSLFVVSNALRLRSKKI